MKIMNLPVGYIVEGFNDERAILRIFPDAVVAVTNGPRYTNRVKMDIQKTIDQCYVVFILTDPDDTGDTYAAYIQREFGLPRIEIDPNEAICYRNNKRKIGVEHCDPAYLKRVLTEAISDYI